MLETCQKHAIQARVQGRIEIYPVPWAPHGAPAPLAVDTKRDFVHDSVVFVDQLPLDAASKKEQAMEYGETLETDLPRVLKAAVAKRTGIVGIRCAFVVDYPQ